MRKIQFKSYRFHSAGPGSGPGPGQNYNQWIGVVLAKWLILAASVMLAAWMFENIEVENFISAIFAAAAIGVLNLFFRPVLLILTLPINVLTLGLFTFVINALMLKMASGVMGDAFSVEGFWTTVFGAIVISVINWFLNAIFADTQRPGGPGFPGPGPGPGQGGSRDDEHIDMEKRGDRWE